MSKKFVIIGSGSQFTEFFLQEFFKFEDIKGSTLVFVDRKPKRLEQEIKLAKNLNKSVDWDVKIEGYNDRKEALEGADFIYCFIAVNQKETWKKEFEIANKHGIYPLEAYTAGPPSLGMSIRHIPPMLDICKDIEEICPNAWLILDNNPLAKLMSAVLRYTKVKSIGYCNGHELLEMAIEQILDMTDRDSSALEADPVEREFMVPAGNIKMTLAGINHCQWIMDIHSTETDEDLYTILNEKIDNPANIPDGYRFSAAMTKVFGLFPSPADNHVADYIWGVDREVQKKYGLEPYPVDQWFGNRDENAWKKLCDNVKDLEAAKDFIKQRRTGWRNLQIARLLMSDEKKYFPAINLINNGAINNLSNNILVEVPALIGKGEITSINVGELPEQIITICGLHGHITNLIADAAVLGSKEKALQALILDPFVPNMITATKILEDILEYNKKYDTRFK